MLEFVKFSGFWTIGLFVGNGVGGMKGSISLSDSWILFIDFEPKLDINSGFFSFSNFWLARDFMLFLFVLESSFPVWKILDYLKKIFL